MPFTRAKEHCRNDWPSDSPPDASVPIYRNASLNVLQQLAKGRTNKEIAAHLFISEDTVKSHIKGLFSKLDVKDRTDAVITALRHGIVHL